MDYTCEKKKMFGSPVYFINRNMFAGVQADNLFIRLSEPDRAEILRHFGRWSWSETARDLIAIPERWLKWALYDRSNAFRGEGPVTLVT